MNVAEKLTIASEMNAEEDFLDYALAQGFGDVHFKVDPETGMKAIIAIHSTHLGPALGGCRFIEYPSTQAAIKDALRLAKGMSYKAASVNLPLGGGKSVIIKPKQSFNRTQYMQKFGQFVNELNGRYITALDSGTELPDMDAMAEFTPYIASLTKFNGDPSPYTAEGVFKGIQAAVGFKLGKDSLKGLHIAIQGIGHVGRLLAHYLREAGATLTIADINMPLVNQLGKELGANIVSTEVIHKVPCDVFAPCALGAVINNKTIDELQTTIIAGAANNQLAQALDGQKLHDKGILYAPDYVINAGGLIYAASKYLHMEDALLKRQIDNIQHYLMEIFKRSAKEDKPANNIADIIAEERLGIAQ